MADGAEGPRDAVRVERGVLAVDWGVLADFGAGDEAGDQFGREEVDGVVGWGGDRGGADGRGRWGEGELARAEEAEFFRVGGCGGRDGGE